MLILSFPFFIGVHDEHNIVMFYWLSKRSFVFDPIPPAFSNPDFNVLYPVSILCYFRLMLL